VLDRLYQHELDKLNARLAQKGEVRAERQDKRSARQQRIDNRLAAKEAKLRERAQGLYERQFGETVRSNRAGEKIQWAGLTLQSARAQADIQQAIADGKRPDASLSKAYGYIVDAGGAPILGRNGKRIPVAKSKTTAKQRESYRDAVGEARDLRGDPIENSDVGPLAPGQFVARPGAKGVYPGRAGLPATTNDPNKARRDGGMGFNEALSYLQESYGLSRAQARKALIAAGWKPSGQRTTRRSKRPDDKPGPRP
jgi:hypothetical protein